ncbi:ABC transporter permease [Xanthobacter versatilis]|uniref:ABC transporter permease n=1 Tax=Xanthobacter autotrophicus (strain ATCC BAA-1158 / Py2) TaxID=78245 RepID=UPI00372B488A
MTNTPRPTRFAGESWRTASAMHARVVGAVIMRDLQTRFGTGYFGFLLGLIMPLGHLTIALSILTALGRAAPIGTSLTLFAMTGVLPFILWLYAHRQVLITLQQNRSLLYFPGVDIFDLFAARSIVEVASGTLITTILLFALSITGFDTTIGNPTGFFYNLITAWTLGISTGLIFGSLTTVSYPFAVMGNLMGPLFWVSSGIIYLPDNLPEKIRNILFYLPLCQIIDGTRSTFFSGYESGFYNENIPIILISLFLALGMFILKIMRRIT